MSFISIINFQQEHEPAIDLMLSEIQKEFSENFSSPGRASIQTLVEQGDFFWTAFQNGKIAGIIGLSTFDKRNAIIKRLFVAKAYRGKPNNVAQQLLQTVITEAKKKGYTDIFLGTMSQFTAAQRFYIKNEFIPIPESCLPEGMKLSVLDTLFYALKTDQFHDSKGSRPL